MRKTRSSRRISSTMASRSASRKAICLILNYLIWAGPAVRFASRKNIPCRGDYQIGYGFVIFGSYDITVYLDQPDFREGICRRFAPDVVTYRPVLLSHDVVWVWLGLGLRPASRAGRRFPTPAFGRLLIGFVWTLLLRCSLAEMVVIQAAICPQISAVAAGDRVRFLRRPIHGKGVGRRSRNPMERSGETLEGWPFHNYSPSKKAGYLLREHPEYLAGTSRT